VLTRGGRAEQLLPLFIAFHRERPEIFLQRTKGAARMKIKPLHDRIIVERIEEETKTAGGLIIPDTAKEKPQQGKVIAVGKGKVTEDGKIIAMDVKEGDRILFGKYSGTEVKLDGKEYLIMREDDVLGIVQ
jgi:chaperonin GroES